MMRLLLLAVFLPYSLDADAIAGAWENFATEANADAWTLYSFSDELFAPPLWAGPEIDENPYAYSFFIGDDGVWFYADDLTAGGDLIGDYATQKISGVDVSVSVDPAEIDFIDLAIYAEGPNGLGFYYSTIYAPEDLGTDPGWYDLSFFFDESWYYFENDNLIDFIPGESFLASIQEIGIRVFPSTQVNESSFVGIDDFILVPTVESPDLHPSVSSERFTLQFELNPGVAGSIEALHASGDWHELPGETDLAGSQSFTEPLVAGTRLFRVVTEERLTPVVSP